MKIETSVKWLYALEDNLHPSVLANTITQMYRTVTKYVTRVFKR